MVKCYVIENLA